MKVQRYQSWVSDSARWDGFRFRAGDIVLSVPQKCGTTWMQTLCAMLVLDTTTFGRTLSELSPWLDASPAIHGMNHHTVLALLEAQRHRRIIKTHTPLDGVPFDDRVTYLSVGRDPRDVALSSERHVLNTSPENVRAICEAAGIEPTDLEPPPDPSERFRRWVDADRVNAPTARTMTLANLLHHLQSFWDRRDEPGIALFHYSDLLADLPGQLRHLAGVLSIEVSDERIEQFAAAATFDQMRQRADEFAPEARRKVFRSNAEFFHRGTAGQWRDRLDEASMRRYDERVAELASPDLAEWVHSGWRSQRDRHCWRSQRDKHCWRSQRGDT